MTKRERLIKAAQLLHDNCKKNRKGDSCEYECPFMYCGCCILEPLPDRQKLEKVEV